MADLSVGSPEQKSAAGGQCQRPAVLIWDRCPVTPAHQSEALLTRIAECEEYAAAQGWQPVGTWIDSGEGTLTADFRPRLDAALSHVPNLRCADGSEREVVVLIHSNDRLSNDALWAASLRRRIRAAGARLVLMVENTDRHECASSTAPPPVADAAVSRTAQ